MNRVLVLLAMLLAPTAAFAMEVSSSSIEDGVLDTDSACDDHDGDDESPQITISDAPAGTTHFAVIMDDPDARPLDGKTWVHWIVVNIPVGNTVLEADETPPGVELEHDDEEDSYSGACPTDGRHVYRIGVFALSAPIEVGGANPPAALTIEMFESRYAAQILGFARIEGAFP
jgi:Raf kinase inhibitor-like YbhB/YbcL family protein